jgi:hypothetical protein
LKDEKNNDNYIKDYIIKAYGFINYFSKTEWIWLFLLY